MYYLQHERPCCIGYTNSSRIIVQKIDLKIYVNQHHFVLDTVADTRGGRGEGR